MDPRIERLDQELAKLSQERAEREALLADPEYQRVRQLYQNVADALAALDEAGERLTDSEGYALYIAGKSFNLDSGGAITENVQRWKKYIRRMAT